MSFKADKDHDPEIPCAIYEKNSPIDMKLWFWKLRVT